MAKHSQGKRFKQENTVQNNRKRNTQNNTGSKNNVSRKKAKINIFLLLFIALFIYSAFILGRWIWSNISAKQANEKLKEEVVEVVTVNDEQVEEEQEKQQNTGFNKIDFSKLKEINSDVVGYI